MDHCGADSSRSGYYGVGSLLEKGLSISALLESSGSIFHIKGFKIFKEKLKALWC